MSGGVRLSATASSLTTATKTGDQRPAQNLTQIGQASEQSLATLKLICAPEPTGRCHARVWTVVYCTRS